MDRANFHNKFPIIDSQINWIGLDWLRSVIELGLHFIIQLFTCDQSTKSKPNQADWTGQDWLGDRGLAQLARD